MPSSAELGNSTWSDLDERQSVVIVPVGSVEQHGPHLPLDTDTRIATAVAAAVTERLAAGGLDVLVAPAIAYGASGEHEGFAGTVSLGTTVLTEVLVEYGRSACRWAPRLVFVNGHGGNTAAMVAAVVRLRAEGRDVAWCVPGVSGSDAHAGHTETSVLLHLSPGDVHFDRAVAGNRAPLRELLPRMRAGGLAAVTEEGILGDPTTATAPEGARIFAEMVEHCVRRIGDWCPDSRGLLV